MPSVPGSAANASIGASPADSVERANADREPSLIWAVLRPFRSTTAVVAVIAAALAFLLMRAWIHAAYFDGQPFDGPFQLFNALDRLAAGQAPWRDFVLFHGIGVVYAHYGFYLLFGQNLFASEFTRQLLSPLAWIAAMSALTYVLTPGKRMALLPIAWFFALSCASNIELPINNPIVSQPGNSLMALRWAFPALCGASLVWAFRPGALSLQRAAVVGVLFGLGPFWSFEQGAYAGAAAIVVIAVWCARDGVLSARWSRLLIFVASFAVAVWLSFSLSTGGDAKGLLRFVFSTIPSNQGWYFGAPPNRSLSLNGVTREILVYITCVVLLLSALVSCADRARCTVGFGFLACYAALSGASLAGILSASYLAPAVSAVIVVAVVLAYSFAEQRAAAKRVGEALSVVAAMAAVGAAFASELPSLRQVGHTQKNERFEVSGTQPVGLHATLEPLMDRIRHAPNHTVFSTYRGLLDLSVSSRPHGRADYIIHALGDDEREKYLQGFEHGAFNFVHTMKPTFMMYEEWLQDAHWDFYRTLIEHYAVVAESGFSLLWQRRTSAVALRRHACRDATPDHNGHWILTTKQPAFLELTIDYHAADPFSSIPVVSGLPRYVLEFQGLTNHLPVSLNPRWTRAAWLVRTTSGTASAITPRVYSVLPGPKLTVERITACEIAIPADTLPAFAHLR